MITKKVKKGPLADFILETQYAPPRTISIPRPHDLFKDHFGLARKILVHTKKNKS